jgi:cytochrome c-type biogenesis protein CcmH
MIALWMMIVLITLGVLAVLLVPMAFRREAGAASREDYDLNIYKDQLLEVEKDLERGLVSEEEAEAARMEIKRRMLTIVPAEKMADAQQGGMLLMVCIGVFVSFGAISGYVWLGSPNQPDFPFVSRNVPQQTASAAPSASKNVTMLNAVSSLSKRLKKSPNDVQGWVLLGRSYMAMERVDDAVLAFKRAMDLGGKPPDVASDYAEAMVIAANNIVPVEARDVFARVLTTDPYNTKARFYLGVDQVQRGNFKGAIQAWTDLIAVSPPGAPWISQVQTQIEKAAQSGNVEISSVKPSGAALAIAQVRAAPTPAKASATSIAPGPTQEDVKAAKEMSPEDRQAMIRSMVQRLADKLEENPNDKKGWLRLARAYKVLGEVEKAKKALERATAF